MTQLTPDQARERLAHAMGYHGELTRRQVLIVSLVFAVLLCIVPLPLLLKRLEQVEGDELKELGKHLVVTAVDRDAGTITVESLSTAFRVACGDSAEDYIFRRGAFLKLPRNMVITGLRSR